MRAFVERQRLVGFEARDHGRPRRRVALVAIDDFPHAELVEQDVRAIFTVEPV